jgi:hypothetical protein
MPSASELGALRKKISSAKKSRGWARKRVQIFSTVAGCPSLFCPYQPWERKKIKMGGDATPQNLQIIKKPA